MNHIRDQRGLEQILQVPSQIMSLGGNMQEARLATQKREGRIALRNFDHFDYVRNRPRIEDKTIYWFRLVDWASNAYCDGSKWMEVRLIQQLPKRFGPGSVICLNPLGNCIVDLVFQIAGLADL
jgi:hypothetical protein